MNSRYESLLEGSIIKSLLLLGVPMVISNLLQSAYQLTDALWVGRLGKDALAAVSVSFPITFLAVALASGFTVAGTTLIAQYAGAKNKKMVNHVAAQTILMVFVVSIVLSLLGYVLAPMILQAMGVEPAVYDHAIGFMRMSFVGLIFVFGFSAVQALMRGVGEAKIPMYIVFGTVLLNFIVDPLFIFGWGAFPGLGVMGAATATLLTQSIAFVVGSMYLFNGKNDIHLNLKDFVPDLAFIKRTFFLGLPASIEMSARSIGMTVMTVLVTAFGTVSIAAYGIATNILMLIVIPALGLSMATSTLVGQNIGAKRLDRAEEVVKISVIASFLLLSLLGVGVFLGAPLLAGMFVPGELETINVATEFIRIMAWTFGTIGVQMCLIGVFRAAGHMVTAMMLTITSQFVFQIPVAWWLSSQTSLGLDGIWWTFPITNGVMMVITALWYLRGNWKAGDLTEDEGLQNEVLIEAAVEEGGRY